MKKNIRALGIDDSYFTPHVPGDVELVGVVMRAPSYIEGIIKRKIKVDGLDSTEKIIDMLRTRFAGSDRCLYRWFNRWKVGLEGWSNAQKKNSL